MMQAEVMSQLVGGHVQRANRTVGSESYFSLVVFDRQLELLHRSYFSEIFFY